MNFDFTETQTMLRDQLARFLADRYDFDSRQAMIARPEGRDPAVWQAFAHELGILGAAFPEDRGGLGGGHVDNMVILLELGRAMALEPYLSTVVVGGGALQLAGGDQAGEMIPRIVDGSAVIAFAWAERQARFSTADLTTRAAKDGAGWKLSGEKSVVRAAPWASHLLVTARSGGGQADAEGVSLFLVPADAPGISRRDYPTVDGVMASEVSFEGVALGAEHLLGAEGGAKPMVDELFDRAVAATCAEAAGTMTRLHAATLDYAKQRQQFGQPIGRFQVIQHMLVDMLMEVEQAVSVTYMATLKLGLPEAERRRVVSQAKAKLAQGARFVGQNAIQIHGGIGITDELAAGHLFKRVTMLESAFGDADFHLGRVEDALLADAA